MSRIPHTTELLFHFVEFNLLIVYENIRVARCSFLISANIAIVKTLLTGHKLTRVCTCISIYFYFFNVEICIRHLAPAFVLCQFSSSIHQSNRVSICIIRKVSHRRGIWIDIASYGPSWPNSWNTDILKNHWFFSALYV